MLKTAPQAIWPKKQKGYSIASCSWSGTVHTNKQQAGGQAGRTRFKQADRQVGRWGGFDWHATVVWECLAEGIFTGKCVC
jgi:hypothetical protein